MEKMRMETPNLTAVNVEKIGALFPNCITESMDENGTLKKAINFDLLRQMLSDDVVEGNEVYEFTWVGKKAAIVEANRPIRKTLRPCPEKSVDWESTENLYIEGDNLEVLKLLQESYLGKVKLIYIDPPYNTGNDFLYKDSFVKSIDEYEIEIGKVDEYGSRLYRNTDSNGRFHSDWCSMLYPRLLLARNLLSDEGVIFISMDDHESGSLKMICDEVFGEENFKSDISWQKRYTRSNNTVDFTTMIEHILVYSKSDKFVVNLLPRDESTDSNYSNPDNDPRGPWITASFVNPATKDKRPNLVYDIVAPDGRKITHPTNAWKHSKEEYERYDREGMLWWGLDGKAQYPRLKVYLSEARGLTPINFWSQEYAGNTDQGGVELKGLMDDHKVFDFPKPVKLIKRILEHATDNNCIVMDFFAGSSTTAQAVMELNAEANGQRHFLLVQMPELVHEQSEAAIMKFHTICDLGEERIRRAGLKIKEKNPLTTQNLDIGFRVFRVDDSNMNDVFYAAGDYTQGLLTMLESNVKSDRTDLDLLFGCLLEWGLPLSMPYKSEKIDGCTVHTYNDGDLIACFDENIPDAVVKEIARRQPLRAVFRDSCFNSSPAKINVGEIFKMLAPDTRVKVI